MEPLKSTLSPGTNATEIAPNICHQVGRLYQDRNFPFRYSMR